MKTLTLTNDLGAGLEASFAPAAGMIGCSLRDRGEELLGQRRGLDAYVAEGSTMGIPLLHPWANRLSRDRLEVGGGEIDLGSSALRLKRDGNGLAMHGLLTAASGWRVDEHEPAGDVPGLRASFDCAADADLLAAFPFPHRLLYEARLSATTLTISLTVESTGDAAVPISFGFHPYLRLPGVERSAWEIEVPVERRLVLDERMLPTGERVAGTIDDGPLGERSFDDAFEAPADGAPFALEGGGRRIELAFLSGYPLAQVFAPPGDELIAFEPMTAPTDALVRGGPELTLLAPGEAYSAAFSIQVTEPG
ncbi:MAG: aldose 1-epimerase [Solirubrobacterales bacterium]